MAPSGEKPRQARVRTRVFYGIWSNSAGTCRADVFMQPCCRLTGAPCTLHTCTELWENGGLQHQRNTLPQAFMICWASICKTDVPALTYSASPPWRSRLCAHEVYNLFHHCGCICDPKPLPWNELLNPSPICSGEDYSN